MFLQPFLNIIDFRNLFTWMMKEFKVGVVHASDESFDW